MGYNHAAAFDWKPETVATDGTGTYKAKLPGFFKHPFEGPVKGFLPNCDKLLIFTTGQLNKDKTEAMLLKLQIKWLDVFLDQLLKLNPEIPREVAVEWVSFHLPPTADDLAMSLTSGEAEKLAFRLADAWDSK